jgi:hypothetical protein
VIEKETAMFQRLKSLFSNERPFTIIDAERICIARLKAEGATEYHFIDIDPWDGQGGSDGAQKYGKSVRLIVDERLPGMANGLDSDRTDWKAGHIAILLPKTHNVELSGAASSRPS